MKPKRWFCKRERRIRLRQERQQNGGKRDRDVHAEQYAAMRRTEPTRKVRARAVRRAWMRWVRRSQPFPSDTPTKEIPCATLTQR